MKIRWQDGFEAAGSAAEIVETSRKNVWFPEKTTVEWMEAVACRVMTMHPDVEVRWETPEEFLADLIAAGVVTIVNGLSAN